VAEAAEALGVSDRHIKRLIAEADSCRRSRWRWGRELINLAPAQAQRRVVRVNVGAAPPLLHGIPAIEARFWPLSPGSLPKVPKLRVAAGFGPRFVLLCFQPLGLPAMGPSCWPPRPVAASSWRGCALVRRCPAPFCWPRSMPSGPGFGVANLYLYS
jgi:hypothetical protein